MDQSSFLLSERLLKISKKVLKKLFNSLNKFFDMPFFRRQVF